jgi:predicted nucleotidyltransferase
MVRPTPYPELNSVLKELVARVRGALGEAFVGAYLQGSFAVGDFDRHSDVDFVIVVAQDLSDGQVHVLQGIHGRIFNLPSQWAQHTGGVLFPSGDSAVP